MDNKVRELVETKVRAKLSEVDRQHLTELFGASRLPTRTAKSEFAVKPQEHPTPEGNPGTGLTQDQTAGREVRLNSAWLDLCEDPGFQAQTGVEYYLWVVRDDGHL